jgi:hypothetical protein
VVRAATAAPSHRRGAPRSTRGETSMADETYQGEFYCVKCKEKREAEGKVVVSENGRRMAKGECPVCGTNLNRILGKA